MKKILLVIFGLILCSNAISKDFTIGKKLKQVSADGLTKAGTGEKIYSKDKTFKIEGDWSEKFVIGHGDCGTDTTWSDCSADRSRVEKDEGYSRAKNKWYKFSFFIPSDYPWKASGNKIIYQMIAQTKAANSREPMWRFDLFQEGSAGIYNFESSGLNIKFGMANEFQKAVTCTDILSWEQMLGKWNEVVFFVNYGKKPTKWLTVGDKKYYAGLWINGSRVELECAEKERMPKGILGKHRNLFSKKGSNFSYGIYLTRVGEYILSEMKAKNMCKGKGADCGLPIKWKKDKGGDAMSKTQYIKNWTKLDWPLKLETRRIWFDNQDKDSSKENIWNMPLDQGEKSPKKNDPKYRAIIKSKTDQNILIKVDDYSREKAEEIGMKQCKEISDQCYVHYSTLVNPYR